jgi:uncharacterized protein YoxC
VLSAKDFLWLTLGVGWLLLVLFLGYVLVKLGSVLRSTEELVDGVTERTVPLLGEVTTSVVQVNGQLERVDAITSKVQDVTTNAASLSALFAATLGGPLVKVAAFTYGVRKAASKRAKSDLEAEIKAARKAKKAGR